MTAQLVRKLWITTSLMALACAVILITNVSGWRSRVVTRLMRVENFPILAPVSSDFRPQVPSGFAVSLFANGFQQPRWLQTAPDGALFVADSAAGQVVVLHEHSDHSVTRDVFADGLELPFGIVFLNEFVYIANTNSVVRFLYDPRNSKRTGKGEHILDLPGYGYNQHWTRSLSVSPDGKTLFVSVGSRTNVSIESDARRAAILSFSPDGKQSSIYATGLRNAVGLGANPETGELWTAVNERDNLGDDIPPDYLTRVIHGGFYGWPYAYDGGIDDRVSSRPDLASRTIHPDLSLGAHVAPLQFAFYQGTQFPPPYTNGVFLAEHGSWNRRRKSGYQVVFIPFRKGMPFGGSMSFMTGFLTDSGAKEVYGRPVGVAVGQDGSLFVSDDANKCIWRVSYR